MFVYKKSHMNKVLDDFIHLKKKNGRKLSTKLKNSEENR